MRTTVSIDDDVLAAARALAKSRAASVGSVLSDLARRSLRKPGYIIRPNGIPMLDVGDSDAVITLELVNRLRDDEF